MENTNKPEVFSAEGLKKTFNDTAHLHFALPIPDWLGANGHPVYQHSCITQNEAGEWAYRFSYPSKDGSVHAVRIDGSGILLFPDVCVDTAANLNTLLRSPSFQGFTPDTLTNLLNITDLLFGWRAVQTPTSEELKQNFDPYSDHTCTPKELNPHATPGWNG